MDHQEYGPPPSSPQQGGIPPSTPTYGPGGYAPPTGAQAPTPAPGMMPPPPSMPPPQYPPVMLTGQGFATTEKNWMGVASLVLGLIGGGVLGAVFGGMGISAANKGRATNKALATWGLVLNITVPILLLIAAISAGALSGVFADRVGFSELALGDCIQEPAGWNDVGEELHSDLVKRVECTEEHWGQVYAIDGLDPGAYPGDDGIVAPAEEVCYSELAMGRILDEFYDQAYTYYVTPTSESWYAGDRTVICFVANDTSDAAESWMAGY